MKRRGFIFLFWGAALSAHCEIIPGMDWVIDFFGTDSQKPKDQEWLSPSEIEQDKFFLQKKVENLLDPPSSADVPKAPLEIHFFGSPISPIDPLLGMPSSAVGLPEFSLYDRPVDYVQGGLKVAKSRAMKQAIESASEGAVYEYLIALETTSPLLASAVKQIQTWANQLNAMGLESYEMSCAKSNGGLIQILQEEILACQHENIALGTDLLEAKTLCQDQSKRKKTLKAMRKRNPTFFVGSYNLGSDLLSSMGFNGRVKELFLNLTGTIVKTESEGVVFYPPLVQSVVSLLFEGKPIKNGYVFEEKKKMARKEITSTWEPRKKKWFSLFQNIQDKLLTDTEFTPEEKRVFSHAKFPAATLIALAAQYQGPGAVALLESSSDSVALEEVFQFVEEALEKVLAQAKALKLSQISTVTLEAYIAQMEEALAHHRREREAHQKKTEQERSALDRLLFLDKEMRRGLREKP